MAQPPETLGPETAPGTGQGVQVRTGATVVAGTRARAIPQPGQRVGRFVVERQLGAGAMGVVLLARDPDLGRPVAIKLLRSDGEDARVRLRREAQAVARIQHPNVIAVHEVGTHGQEVYVVMEYVDGGTLRDWVHSEHRPWQEVLSVYRQAGLGLIAAHQAGLVHRDFKPDNVLIGRDGRVRVTDFGIVGVHDRIEASQLDATIPIKDVSARLTQTGAIIGTPAYMPPEQYGAGADARSDQFAFCVSLYEALFGVRPHEGDSVGALLYAVQSGKVRPVQHGDVPAGVVAAILQGLRPDPSQRHPSMHALLRHFEAKKRTPKWPFAVAGIGVVALVGAGAALHWSGGFARSEASAESASPSAPIPECPDAEAEFAQMWNDDRRATLRGVFEPNGPVQAAASEKVSRALDARAREWIGVQQAACTARTHYDLQRSCLEEARLATGAFVDVLSSGERAVIDGAVSAVTMLPRIVECEAIETLEQKPRATDAQRDALASLRKDMIVARSLLLAGKQHEAIALGTSLEEKARESGFDGAIAPVLEILARGEMQIGKLVDAEAHAREATALAEKAGDASVEARAFGTLVLVVAGTGRPAEALGMLSTGRAAYARTSDPRARSYFKAAEGVVLMHNGDIEGAGKATDEVIEILQTVEPVPSDELANAYSNHAAVALARGDSTTAQEDQRRALEIAEAGLGKDHSLYGAVALALGMSLYSVGEYEEALTHHRAALAAWEASLGRDHTNCAAALNNIGIALLMLGRRDEAVVAFEDALRRYGASGHDDPNTRLGLLRTLGQQSFFRGEFAKAESHFTAAAALVRETMGAADPNAALLDQAAASMRYAQGDDEGALKGHRGVEKALIEIYGPKHQLVAVASAFVGDSLQRLGRYDEALRAYSQTFRIYSDLSLPADSTLAETVAGQGVCQLATGKLEEAEATLGRAAELSEQLNLEGEEAAAVQFAVAKGHLSAGDRETAGRLSADVEAIYVGLGPGYVTPLAEVRRWRATNGW